MNGCAILSTHTPSGSNAQIKAPVSKQALQVEIAPETQQVACHYEPHQFRALPSQESLKLRLTPIHNALDTIELRTHQAPPTLNIEIEAYDGAPYQGSRFKIRDGGITVQAYHMDKQSAFVTPTLPQPCTHGVWAMQGAALKILAALGESYTLMCQIPSWYSPEQSNNDEHMVFTHMACNQTRVSMQAPQLNHGLSKTALPAIKDSILLDISQGVDVFDAPQGFKLGYVHPATPITDRTTALIEAHILDTRGTMAWVMIGGHEDTTYVLGWIKTAHISSTSLSLKDIPISRTRNKRTLKVQKSQTYHCLHRVPLYVIQAQIATQATLPQQALGYIESGTAFTIKNQDSTHTRQRMHEVELPAIDWLTPINDHIFVMDKADIANCFPLAKKN